MQNANSLSIQGPLGWGNGVRVEPGLSSWEHCCQSAVEKEMDISLIEHTVYAHSIRIRYTDTHGIHDSEIDGCNTDTLSIHGREKDISLIHPAFALEE